jgi:CubicO group peptidase (beta-lactamase class C family)
MQIYLLLFLIAWIKAETKQSQCPPTVSSIQPILDKALMYGTALVVVDANGMVYEQAFGYDSPLASTQPRAIDLSDSIFLLASVSKTFIAVAAMQMVEANHLNLDANINQYLAPDLNVVHPLYPNIPITMRHLLMHASGIGVNAAVELESYTLNDTFTQINLGEVLKKYFNSTSGWLPIPPGNKTFYSNAGTNLAAYIIERLAGMRFEHYVQEKILKPLGITDKMGGYRLSNFDQKHLVRNYLYNESISTGLDVFLKHLNATRVGDSRWIYIPFHGSSLYASGYARMSARGLSLFLQAFLKNFTTLLRNSSSVEQMVHVSPQESYPTGSPSEYGLIWNWITLGKRRLIGHQGSLIGATNIMLANEKRTLGAILLSTGDLSTNTSHSMEVGNALVSIMTQLFDCFEENQTITTATASNQSGAPSSIPLMIYLLSVYVFSFFVLF